MEEAFLLVQPNAKEVPPKCMIPSGLDAILWFDCEQDECQRRADGRRVDRDAEPETREIYNVTTLVPPTNQAPLCERLEAVTEEFNHSSLIVDKICSFNQQTNSLKRWLEKFGDEDKQRPLLHMIDATVDEKKVNLQVREVLDQIKSDKARQRGFLVELMAFKLKAMFEQKMKLLLGDAINVGKEEEIASAGQVEETNAAGELSAAEKSAAGPVTTAQPTPADQTTTNNPTRNEMSKDAHTKSRLSTNMARSVS